MRVLAYFKTRRRLGRTRGIWLIAAAVLVPLAACVMMVSGLCDKFISLPPAFRNYSVDVLFGELRFLYLVVFFAWGVVFIRKKWLSWKGLAMLILVLTAADLVIFNLRFNNIVAPPPLHEAFYAGGFSYHNSRLPPHALDRVDKANYRFGQLQNAGIYGNRNLVFRLPVFSGILGYMPDRFYRMIVDFGYPPGTRLIYPRDVKNNERLLDLSAVRYVFGEGGAILERPGTLSRFRLFVSYRVIPNDRQLMKRLRDSAFDPLKTLLLSEPLRQPFVSRPLPSVFVPVQKESSDEVQVSVAISCPALLLFDDSYHKGWKAYVDGKEVPVYRANFNFMACYVPPGTHNVEWRFAPASFGFAALLSLLGAVLLILGTIVLFVRA